MKIVSSASIAALSLLACLAPAAAMDDHKVLTPNDVKWGPAPASVPKGAQAAAIWTALALYSADAFVARDRRYGT